MDNNNSISEDGNISVDVKPMVYSKTAIKGFSFFFSTIFGGVLLYRNLKSLNKDKEAYIVLGLSIVYTALTVYVVNIPERPQSSISYLLNLIGGAILAEYFFGKYLGSEKDYQKKKIWKPLIISMLISIPLLLAMFYEAGII
ncbi:MAG: hypothetical protein ABJF04_03355 [Reichenbachiella sp.]|uniref:hypothetical protein n=1 Tax=Reichenbachiella sp. TaxID=2184521 RepID=UPI0032653014